MIIIIIIIIIIKAIYSQSGENYLLILSQRCEEKPYFTDEPSVPLSCTGQCLLCTLLRHHRCLQLSLTAWREETKTFYFSFVQLKHFVCDINPSRSKRCWSWEWPIVPSSKMIIWSRNWRSLSSCCNEAGTVLSVLFTCNGYTHRQNDIRREKLDRMEVKLYFQINCVKLCIWMHRRVQNGTVAV